VFDSEGKLDRVKLGDIIFKDKEKRSILNRIYKNKVLWGIVKKFY